MERLNNPFEYKEFKYLFGHYSSEEKVWYIQPRRFVLLKDTNKNVLIGEFIQSIWFNKIYYINNNCNFVILKVKKDVSCKKIEKDMNSLKNPFPTLYDIPPYISGYSYFILPWQLVNQCISQSKTQDFFKFTLRAFNNPRDKLTLDIRPTIIDDYNRLLDGINNLDGIDNQRQSITITLPSFETAL
jgi:hypothetical protein